MVDSSWWHWNNKRKSIRITTAHGCHDSLVVVVVVEQCYVLDRKQSTCVYTSVLIYVCVCVCVLIRLQVACIWWTYNNAYLYIQHTHVRPSFYGNIILRVTSYVTRIDNDDWPTQTIVCGGGASLRLSVSATIGALFLISAQYRIHWYSIGCSDRQLI